MLVVVVGTWMVGFVILRLGFVLGCWFGGDVLVGPGGGCFCWCFCLLCWFVLGCYLHGCCVFVAVGWLVLVFRLVVGFTVFIAFYGLFNYVLFVLVLFIVACKLR